MTLLVLLVAAGDVFAGVLVRGALAVGGTFVLGSMVVPVVPLFRRRAAGQREEGEREGR